MVKIDLYQELEHTGDLAYEIRAKNLEELLKDVVYILLKNSELDSSEEFSNFAFEIHDKKCYNIITDVEDENFSDNLFDIINDLIYIIDKGFQPIKVEGFCVYFRKCKSYLRIKALTYHKFLVQKQGDEIYARMVFDV